jgi:predicted ATPase
MPEKDCFVLTGGPGAGKTTLISALAARGYRTSPEAGRAIIRLQTPINGRAVPWIDPALFAELMLSWDLQAYEDGLKGRSPAFFDRGIPDVLGYLRLSGLPAPDHLTKAIARCRYNRRVFVCPPWRAIFANDTERRQTFDEAERTYEAVTRAYADHGYDLIEIPKVPVEKRLAFVLEQISG